MAMSRLATMQAGAYNASSRGQLAAHSIAHPALRRALARLVRLSIPSSAIRVCDFGAAGGANAVKVARIVHEELVGLGDCTRELDYAFNDLPASDFNELFRTLGTACLPRRILTSAVARSFYEPCFPAASVHLALSYITLHWLSAAPSSPAARLGPSAVLPNEKGVLASALLEWSEHAHADLVTFLRLRAAELADGGEGVFLMVGGGPNHWVQPPDGGPSLFTRAMAAALPCSSSGLNAEHLNRATVPYYLRSEDEVRAAVAEVSELELVETVSAPILVCEDASAGEQAELAWAIHGHSLEASSGAPARCLGEWMKPRLAQLLEAQCGTAGAEIWYLSLAVRRKPRGRRDSCDSLRV